MNEVFFRISTLHFSMIDANVSNLPDLTHTRTYSANTGEDIA